MTTHFCHVFWNWLQDIRKVYRAVSIAGLAAVVFALAGAQPSVAAVYTWNGSGAGAGNIFDSSANWGGTLPSDTGDTALFGGANSPYAGGALALYYSNGSIGGNSGDTGLNVSLQSSQTAAVSLDTTTTASLRLASITVNSGAGAFTLGGGTTAFMVTLGGGGGSTQTLNNYSSNPFTIGANVSFGGGGGGTHTINFTGAGNFTCNNSFTPSNAGIGAVFTFADDCTGVVTLTGASGYTGATFVNSGILAITGSGSLSATGSIMIANGGAAAMYQSGSSSVTNTSTALGGFQIGGAPGAFGYYNLAGGTINVAGEIDPGGSSGGAGTFGQLDMSAGLINLPTAASSWFLPNRGGSGEASAVNMSGGTVNFVNNATGFRPNWSTSQSSTFTISGSARFLSPGANVYLNQNSVASNVSVLNLNGGIFQALGFSNEAFGVLNFNGGYLKAGNAANASYLAGLAAAYVNSSGGTIDNNGQTITIGQALLAPTGSGLMTGTTPVSYSSGFIVPPQVVMVGTGSGATAYATINQASGAITSFVVTNPGVGYTAAPTVDLITTSGTTILPTSIWQPTLAANGAPSGSGGLTFVGGGTTSLTGVNTFTGPTVLAGGALNVNADAALGAVASVTTFSGGTLQFGGNIALSASRNMAINSGATGYFDTLGNSATVASTITGGGTLAKVDNGALFLTGSSSFTGGTVLSAGTLDINSDAALGAVPGSATTNVTIAGGTLQFGANNVTVNARRTIAVNSGTAFIDPHGFTSVTIAGAISGAGAVAMAGGGTLTLTGSSNYTGVTTVNIGTLALASASLNSSNVSVGATGGTLAATGVASISGSLTNNGTVNLANGSIDTLTVGKLFLASNAVLNFDVGSTAGTCDKIVVTGKVNILQFGGQVINITQPIVTSGTYGLLTAAAGSNLDPGGADFTLNTPKFHGTEDLNKSTATSLILTVSANPYVATAYWTGSASRAASDTSDLWGDGTSTSNWATNTAGTTDAKQVPGPITNVIFNAANAVPNLGGNELSTALDANYAIQGLTISVPTMSGTQITATLIRPNGFTLTLGGSGLTLAAASLSGGTFASGTIQLATSQSWANNNASLPLVVNDTIAPSVAGLTTLTFNGTGAGGIALNSTLGDGSGQLALVFNQTGLTQLNAANAFTGGVTISSGTVQLGNAGALNATAPNAVAFAFGSGAVGDLQLNGNSLTVPSLSSDGSVQAVLENANSTAGTLTVANAVASTYGGTLRDGSGGGALTLDVAGNSTLVLSGTNSYTGGTSINSGTLEIGAGGNTGTLGAGSAVDNSVLVFNRSDSYTLGNSVSGSGSLYEIGNGTLTLAGTNTLLGSIYATGAPSGSGALGISGSAASTSARSLFVGTGSGSSGYYTQSGGVLTVTGTTFNAATGTGLTVASSTGSTGTLNITGGTINGAGPLMVWSGTGAMTVSQTGVTPTFVNPGWLTLGQTSGAAGTLTQNGGTIALTAAAGADFFDGFGAGATGTYIMHGGLLAARNIRNDSGAATVYQDGGVIALSGAVSLGINASASGSYTLAGGLLQTPNITEGAGTAAFNFSGGTLQNTPTGNLAVTMPVNLSGSGSVNIDSGQTGSFNSSASIGGGGSLFKLGGGTLTLSGTNTYGGGTNVFNGTLIVTAPQGIEDGTSLYVGSASAFFAPVLPSPAAAPTTAVPEPGALALLAALLAGSIGRLLVRPRATVLPCRK